MDTSVYDAYREAFPDSKLCFLMPDGDVAIVDLEHDREYKMPQEETTESFLDRIERSRVAGRNLFFEEWPLLGDEWENDPDILL